MSNYRFLSKLRIIKNITKLFEDQITIKYTQIKITLFWGDGAGERGAGFYEIISFT